MNWRRGFARLWIVASLCWIAFIGGSAYRIGMDYSLKGITEYAALAVLPIIAAFALGMVVAWVIVGFRRDA